MSAPKRSVARQVNEDVIRRFSSLDDLVDSAVDLGRIADVEDLYAGYGLEWIEFFHQWVKQGATGCRFAQARALHANEARWLPLIFQDPVTDETAVDLQHLLVSADDAQAALLLTPWVRSDEDLAGLIGTLCRHPSWYWREVVAEGVDDPDHVLVGLRWTLPNSRYESWVLAFADLETQPFTRRAPVAALTLRTHPPASPREDGGVDLAQMPRFDNEIEREEYFRDQTAKGKAELLGGELEHAAKAKVTCRLPRELLELLPEPGAEPIVQHAK